MSKNLQIRNSKIIFCLSFILKNLRALDQLYLSELVGFLNYPQKVEIKKWPDQKEAIEYLKSEFLV